MRRTDQHNAEAVTYILRRIERGEDLRILWSEAHRLIKGVNPADIAAAEQNLIDAGCPARTARQLSAAFLFIAMRTEQRPKSDNALPPSHLLSKVTAEHDMIRCMLADLREVVQEIAALDCLRDTSSEFRRLVHTVAHLDNIREHIDREEHVILPYLRQYGWPGVCHPAQCDHLCIANEIDNLVRLIGAFYNADLEQFKTWLVAVTGRLIPRLSDNLSYEDEILHPIAVAVIDDIRVWEKMKALCEDIGYCGVYH